MIFIVNFKSIVKNLQKHYPDASEVAIVSGGGKILFSTTKWDIKGGLKNFLSSWRSGTAQSVELSGIRYSVLQMEPERFIGTNRHKKGHLVGAATPDGDRYMIAHIKPKAKGWFHMAYPAIARAAAMMQKGSDSKFLETDVEGAETTSQILSQNIRSVEISIDPYLKAEVEGFLEWIKNAGGLPSYLSYTLEQNDPNQIAKLAKLYYELYRLFYP